MKKLLFSSFLKSLDFFSVHWYNLKKWVGLLKCAPEFHWHPPQISTFFHLIFQNLTDFTDFWCFLFECLRSTVFFSRLRKEKFRAKTREKRMIRFSLLFILNWASLIDSLSSFLQIRDQIEICDSVYFKITFDCASLWLVLFWFFEHMQSFVKFQIISLHYKFNSRVFNVCDGGSLWTAYVPDGIWRICMYVCFQWKYTKI